MANGEPVVHDGRPAWLGTVGAVGSTLTVVALTAGSLVGLVLAAVGAVCVGVGLGRTRRTLVVVGLTASFGAVLYTGFGRDPLWLLGGTVPVALAWVLSGTALRLGRQVGRTDGTARVETVHGVTTLVVALLGGGIGYLGYRSVTGSQSPLALVFLLGPVLAVILVLR